MYTDKLEELPLGWLIGNFEPSIIKTDRIEAAVKYLHKGYYEGFYRRLQTREVIVVISGSVEVFGERYEKGDIIVFEPGDEKNFWTLSDAAVLIFRTPSQRFKSDVHFLPDISLERVEEVYRKGVDLVWSKPAENQGPPSGIEGSQITAIVQGAVDISFTGAVLKSVRKHLPGAVVLLSTWEGQEVGGLDFDEVIFNKDPGGLICEDCLSPHFVYNVNRQLVSVVNALKKVRTRYALKLRSDTLLMGSEFLGYFDRYPKRREEYIFFEQRVIVPEIFTRRFLRTQVGRNIGRVDTPYHVTDWVMFGLSADLHRYFDQIPFARQEDMNYDYVKKQRYPTSWNMPPEQYYFVKALGQKFHIEFDHVFDLKPGCMEFSDHLIYNNFLILNERQLCLYSGKHYNVFFLNNGESYEIDGLIKNKDFIKYYHSLR